MLVSLIPAQVVIDLILDLRQAGHPFFAGVQEEEVRRKAATLPENGVPPEVLTIITSLDDSYEKLQPQKAATPQDGFLDMSAAGEVFAAQRPRAAVPEGQADEDLTHTYQAAVKDIKDALATDTFKPGQESLQTLEIRTGNTLMDQFQPAYFAIAFCFCFQYGTAFPDVSNTTQQHLVDTEGQILQRREAWAPQVDIHTWAGGMLRRIEAQFRRDWNFGFTLWNYLFRTMVNLQKNTYIYQVSDDRTGRIAPLSNDDIAKGAIDVGRKLHKGTYTDSTGAVKAVGGDMTKLRHVPDLTPAAHKMLSNCEARARNIPGTHEIRKTMRHQTHAYRVAYGTSIFLTFSPSERDSALMLRLARVRAQDPALRDDDTKTFQQRGKPELDVDYVRLDPDAVLASEPWPIQNFFFLSDAFNSFVK